MQRRPRRSLYLLAFAPLGLYLACGGDPKAPVGPTNDPGEAGTGDGGPRGGGITRGPTSLDFDPSGNGDPISLLWHDALSTLYIADNRNNQIWTWTDAAGFVKLVTVPDDPAATDAGQTNLGQIVRLADGTLVVPRFGFGQRGGLVYVNPTEKTSGTVANLELKRRRVALAATGTGNGLWGAYFLTGPGSEDAGVVTKISALSDELEYATGFQKPVAVIVLKDRLIVSTAPYGHGGSVPSLAMAIDLHRTLGMPPGNRLTNGVVDPWLAPFEAEKAAALLAFVQVLGFAR